MTMTFSRRRLLAGAAAGAAAAPFLGRGAAAETRTVRIAQQYGLGYLQIMVMKDRKLIERHAEALGLGAIETQWMQFSGTGPLTEAILSGQLDFGAGGFPGLLILWDRTRGSQGARAAVPLPVLDMILNTKNPAVRTIADITDKDRIALPAVGVSPQALTLKMAAEATFGAGQQNRLDANMVALAHPDALAAMMNPAHEVTASFTNPPFSYRQLEIPGVRTILRSFDVFGGPHTSAVVWSTAKFRDANPRTFQAFIAAFKEATDIIVADKAAAAEFYVRETRDTGGVASILRQLQDPSLVFTLAPSQVEKLTDFMFRIGMIKTRPESWKDVFFPEVHNLMGS